MVVEWFSCGHILYEIIFNLWQVKVLGIIFYHVESANSELSEGKDFPGNCSNHLDGMGVRHSPQTPRMEHTFIIKTTTCCICSIVCLYYFLQLENNGKIMKERMPWWHDE